jgi:hypothetical protein
MTGSHDLPSCLTPDHIRSFSLRDLFNFVQTTNDPHVLRSVAGIRFGAEATVQNDDHAHPFISWPAINREPAPWLPIALAKVAQHEFQEYRNGDLTVIVGTPRSATWYSEPIRQAHVFPNSFFPLLLKEKQFEKYGADPSQAVSLDVPSYVHGRSSSNDPRVPQRMYFFQRHVYDGASAIIFDDALAEGVTVSAIARFVTEELGARRVFAAFSMAKEVEGGLSVLGQSQAITKVVTLVTITGTHGKGKTIEYTI